MTEQTAGALPRAQTASPFRPLYAVYSALAFAVMLVAIVGENMWLLTFVHIMAGVLWTGIDLFMGFVVGPVLRRLPLETRSTVISGIVPRTLLLMPTLSITTATAGIFLAQSKGYFDLGYPEFYWVIAALAVVTVLGVQGLFYLLPTNLWLYFALQKPEIDTAAISRRMNVYVRVTGIQGCMQVAIIVVMAKFGSGL